MPRSFAIRLAIAFAGVGIAAAALTAILVNVAFGTRFTSYLQQQQQARQAEVVRAVEDSFRRNEGWSLEDLRNLSALAVSDGGEVRLMDETGEVIWEPTATPAGSAMAQMHREMMGGGPLGPEEMIPVEADGQMVGELSVRLPQPGLNPDEVSFREEINRLLLIGGVIAALIALGLGIVLARRTTAPARELTAAARELAAGDRTRRVRVDSTIELGSMGEAFNTMADTIEEEDRLRRLFATDVAHELRTPLAILRTQIEALQDGVSQPTPEVLGSLHEETLRLTHLVEDLEQLASAEAARFSLRLQRLDLAPVVEEVAREFAGPYESKGVALTSDIATAIASADPVRIHQIVTNLLSNALKYTEPGGSVRLSVSTDATGTRITVSDTGPGISAGDLMHVFDRFWRGRDARAGGSGIGLTVVQELAQAQGGRVSVDSSLDHGATFTVTLPPVSEPSALDTPLEGEGRAP